MSGNTKNFTGLDFLRLRVKKSIIKALADLKVKERNKISSYFGAKRRKIFFVPPHFSVVPTHFLHEIRAEMFEFRSKYLLESARSNKRWVGACKTSQSAVSPNGPNGHVPWADC